MADHALDAQAHAFRAATDDDLVDDEQIAAMLRSGELANTTADPRVSVEAHEQAGWDAGRAEPKTIDEARAALAERVQDPTAPDDDPTAYDDDLDSPDDPEA
jgi:hypothetical protein